MYWPQLLRLKQPRVLVSSLCALANFIVFKARLLLTLEDILERVVEEDLQVPKL
jgi:hypothetical protein